MINYGPSWVVRDGEYVLPERTLGWECLGWCAEWLINPETGGPWVFTDEQARLVLWLYALDERGERLTMKSMIQRAKGWGKDPFAAALCLFELVGPCRFSHFDEDGEAVGRQNLVAWVQLAATTTDQNKNTVKMIHNLLTKRCIDNYSLDVQKQVIHVKGTGRSLEAISSNFQGAEGNRPTFAILNEVHWWTPSRSGPELYETISNNADKVDGWYLAITNAYMPGQGSVAELIRNEVIDSLAGVNHGSGWFYDSLEANSEAPLTPPEVAEHVLRGVYGDSYWVKISNIARTKLRDTSISVAKLRRMFYNQVVTADDALFSESEWRQNVVQGAALREGDEIVLGFDGGRTEDATALVAMRISDRLAIPIHIWQRPDVEMDEPWSVSPEEVESQIRMCFKSFKVRAFFADVHPWESYINQWGDEYRDRLLVKASANSTIGFDMRGNQNAIGAANEALMAAVIDGNQPVSADPLLMRHALNARRFEDKYEHITFRKDARRSKNKVDAYAAMLLAYMALQKYLESGRKAPPERDNTVYIF